MSTVARAARATPPVDIDRVLQARYLAAVMKELEALPVPVDGAVLDGPRRPGGTIVLRDQGATGDPPRPSCVRWNGGRCWTLVSPLAGGGVRRHRLRRNRLPAPQEVAQFVAQFAVHQASGTRRTPRRWLPVPGWRPARGH